MKIVKEEQELVELNVRIVRCKHFKNESGWGLYEILVLDRNDINESENRVKTTEEANMVGVFDKKFYEDEEYIVYATPKEDRKWGFQWSAQVVQEKFDSRERVDTFVRSFVSDSIADQLLDKYGDTLLDHIVNDTLDYSDIYGMASVRYNALREKVLENKFMKDLIINLSKYDITAKHMQAIAKRFKANAIQMIEENPYCLCQIKGLGFKKVDDIAHKMGFDKKSMMRISEGIKYLIEEHQKTGHSWIKKTKLISLALDLLDVDKTLVKDAIELGQDLYVDETRVSLMKTYNAEQEIAEILKSINDKKIPLNIDIDDFIRRQEEKRNIKLTDHQKQLFYNFVNERLNYLVGVAGSGKSFLQGILMDLIDELHMSPLLLAPTGRAAQILTGYVGRQAYTIHKQLGFGRGQDDLSGVEIWSDLLIVDESSMCDIYLMQRLLRALKNPSVRIIFSGDAFQLPSVGIGSYLYDCTKEGVFPSAILTQVFRTEDGGILDIATKIRLGERFINDYFTGIKNFGKDFVLHSVSSNYMEDGYMHYFKKALESYDINDIVIATPTNKGKLGTQMINNKIQAFVNPQDGYKKEVEFGKQVVFREGDRIIHVKNTYDIPNLNGSGLTTDVMNGDIGTIEEIKYESQQVLLRHSHCLISVGFKQLEIIKHSWALSIHKLQGSAFDCVITIVDKAHSYQLNANLLYTAITRSKKQHYMLCQSNVINLAMKKVESQARNTFLEEFILNTA